MAHQINFNQKRGTYSFASAVEKAWHGLGQIVDTAMTAEQAIQNANLDYQVQLTPIYAHIDDGNNQVKIDERFATYRTDTNEVLGMVGSRYEIVQNRDAFSFFDAIIDSGEAIFETAGALGKGERIFVAAKLPDDMLVNGEKCEKYILLTNSHDGSSGIIAGFTTIRVVCNNTLQAAMKNLTNKVSIPHRIGAKDKLYEAHKLMKISSIYMNEVQQVFERMSNVAIDDEGLQKFIIDVMKPENQKEQLTGEELEKFSAQLQNKAITIFDFAKTHPTQTTPASSGTVWGAYNAISGYYNYIYKFKNEEQKFASQIFGNANTKILKAFNIASELCHI